MKNIQNNDNRVAESMSLLVEGLLRLLSKMAVISDAGDASRFRADLEAYRRQLVACSVEDTDATVRQCLSHCQDYFNVVHANRARTEAEYASIIDALKKALATLCGQSEVHGLILGSTQRFREIAKETDIHRLRQQIEREATAVELKALSQRRRYEEEVEALSQRIVFLECRLDETTQKLSMSRQETLIDPLTAVFNRRHFDRQLQAWSGLSRHASPFVLVMADVDNFKDINDQHGHQAGDCVLSEMAQIIRRMTRPSDIVARYGGEEFAILFDNMTIRMAEERCRKVLDLVRHCTFGGGVGLALHVTVSFGLAESEQGESAESLLKHADDALYRAKLNGKDCLAVHRRSS